MGNQESNPSPRTKGDSAIPAIPTSKTETKPTANFWEPETWTLSLDLGQVPSTPSKDTPTKEVSRRISTSEKTKRDRANVVGGSIPELFKAARIFEPVTTNSSLEITDPKLKKFRGKNVFSKIFYSFFSFYFLFPLSSFLLPAFRLFIFFFFFHVFH